MCACSDGFALSLRVAGKRGGLKEGRGEGEGGREGGKGRWEREKAISREEEGRQPELNGSELGFT